METLIKKRIQVTPLILSELNEFFKRNNDPEEYVKDLTVSQRLRNSEQIISLITKMMDLYKQKTGRTETEIAQIRKNYNGMIEEIKYMQEIMIFPYSLILSRNVEYYI